MQREFGRDVSVILPDDGPLTDPLRELGAEVHIDRLHVLRYVDGLTSVRVPASLPVGARDADTVVLWTIALAAYLPVLKMLRKQIVVSVHEILESRSGSMLARTVGLSGARIMANSRATETWLLSHGCRPSRVAVAYPATDAYEPTSFEEHGEAVALLLAGRVNGHKGHVEAVRGCQTARAAGVDVRLVLAGGCYPGQEPELHRLQSEIDGKGWITYIGEIDDVYPHLRRADAMLVPTTRPEPFGVVALEAWCAGRRVIASDSGGLAEAARLVDGIVVPPGDSGALAQAIIAFAASPELRASPSRDAAVSRVCTLEARRAAWRQLAPR